MQEPADIHVAYTPDLSLSQFEMSGIRRESEMKEQGALEEDRSNQVQTTRLYHTAEVFINSVSYTHLILSFTMYIFLSFFPRHHCHMKNDKNTNYDRN